jgi:predicted NAD-dependent protein-ADP-ribosyltransferase YbiA (DUF1768 family)
MPRPPNADVLKRAKEARRLRRKQIAKGDKRRNYTMFNASASFDSGLYHLSNLSAAPFTLVWPKHEEAIPLHLRGERCSYDSSEHAYQSLKTVNRESARQFETGGIVSMKIFKKWPSAKPSKESSNAAASAMRSKASAMGISSSDEYSAKMKHWGLKGSGIAPKMVSNLDSAIASAAFGIDMLPKSKREPRSGKLSEELKVWGPILRQKFHYNADARNILIGTKDDILIERSRMPRAAEYWAGYVSAAAEATSGEIIGKNMMGRLLMHTRAEIVAELSE